MTYLYRIQRRMAWTLTCLLAIMSGGCSGNELLDEITLPSVTNDAVSIPSDTIHIRSLADLEALTASDFIGNDGEGMEITSLTYNCTDTLGLNILVLDLEATIKSGDKERVVSRTAEWTVELVGVEYLPITQIDLFTYSYVLTCAVERYRYYSDGSCIGPDYFVYDRNPIIYKMHKDHSNPSEFPGLISVEKNEDFTDPSLDPMMEPCQTTNWTYTYNNNCKIIGWDGREITPYELYYLNPISNSSDLFENWGPCTLGTGYIESMLQNPDVFHLTAVYDYEKLDPMFKELREQCKNAPLIEPVDYVRESVKSTDGWYWAPEKYEYLDFQGRTIYMPYGHYIIDYMMFEFQEYFNIYGKLLEIDGRSINFADLMDTKLHTRTSMVTQTSTGYIFTFKNTLEVFGQRMNSVLNFELIFVDGPTETVDYTSLGFLEELDEYLKEGGTTTNPLMNQPESGNTVLPSGKEKPRLDMRLPDSFTKLPASYGKIR